MLSCIPGDVLSPKNCPFAWGDLNLHLIHASFGPPESTTQAGSRAVQPFLHSSQQRVAILYNVPPLFLLKIAFSEMRGSEPPSLGQFEFSTQTSSRSVQPLLHSSRQSVPTLYSGPPFPSKLPLPMGMWTSSNTWFLGPTGVLNPNGILISSAVFQGSLL